MTKELKLKGSTFISFINGVISKKGWRVGFKRSKEDIHAPSWLGDSLGWTTTTEKSLKLKR